MKSGENKNMENFCNYLQTLNVTKIMTLGLLNSFLHFLKMEFFFSDNFTHVYNVFWLLSPSTLSSPFHTHNSSSTNNPFPTCPFLSFMTFSLVVWPFSLTRDTCATLDHNCPLELASHHTCWELNDCVLPQAGIPQSFSLFWLLEYFSPPSTMFSEPCSKWCKCFVYS